MQAMTNEELKFNNLGDAITVFLTNCSKKERELKLHSEKVEYEVTDLRRKKEDAELREVNLQNTISKLNKDNQLVKTNLRDVYEELLSLVFPDHDDS
jgi:uncharacterized protein (DUF3084 family)